MRWARDGARATPFRLLRAAINMPPPFMELDGSARASLLGLLRGAGRTLQRERLAAGDQVRDLLKQLQTARSREAERTARLAAGEAALEAAQAEAAAEALSKTGQAVAEAESAAQELSRRPDINLARVRRYLALEGPPGPRLRRDMQKCIANLGQHNQYQK